MKKITQHALFMSCVLGLSFSIATIGHAADVTGTWKTIDDKTGFAKSMIKIEKNTNGTYGGTIIKVLSHTGYTPEKYCIDCPEPFTHKPIEGMNIMWGLVPNASQDGLYDGGKILDPLSGHMYKAKITLSPDGNTLNVRGYIGFSFIGRSQIWHREN
jgi:uncharacterized protein (DUF2147 family)